MVLAAERLDKVPPGQRGWEWRYLKRQTRGGLFTLYGHTGPVCERSFSPDGTRIVTGSRDRTAKVWDARTGTALLELKGHMGAVGSASFSPDGTRIVTGSDDGTAKVWDARTGSALLELEGHTGAVTSVSFSPDGSRIVTGSRDRTAKVWDARTGAALLELGGHNGLGERRVVQPRRLADRHRQLGPDGEGLGRADGVAFARTEIAKDESHSLVPAERVVQPRRLADRHRQCGREGESLGCADGLTSERGHSTGCGAAFSPDGRRIVTGVTTAKVWDVRTGEPLIELKGHTEGILCGSFSPDGTRHRHRQCRRNGEGVGRTDGHAPARAHGHNRFGEERVVQPGRLAHRHRR